MHLREPLRVPTDNGILKTQGKRLENMILPGPSSTKTFHFNQEQLGSQTCRVCLERPNPLHSLHREKRIPPGPVIARIPLESAKAYPMRIWEGLANPSRIAYSDRNSHGEDPTLNIKIAPGGAKTAQHPQVVFFVNGSYHIEELSYLRSDPRNWTTWMEIHLDARGLGELISSLIHAREEIVRS
jgi:hypothetical protein